MNDWQTRVLGDLSTFAAGSAFPKEFQGNSTGEIPFIKVSDMSLPGNERLITRANNWISAVTARERRVRPVPAGSSVFAKIGEGLKSERIRVITRPTVIDNNMMAATATDLADPGFLSYLLRVIGLTSLAHGSALPYLRQQDLEKLVVLVPYLPEQVRITGVLGALDDLIDTNTQLADQMDTRLSTVVKDALDRAEESEPLSSYADFVNGRNFTKGADGTGRPVIRTPEVRLGPSGSTPRSSIDAVDANVARSGDTLFVWSGSLTFGRWRWEDGLVNQHVFKVIPRAGTPDWLPNQLIQRQLPWFLSLAADKATTMGHIQRRHLDAPVPALETSVLSRLDEIAGPLWAASLDARTEADRLAGVRDELLPLLMSGRITVDEAWEAVS